MDVINSLLEPVRDFVRAVMGSVATALNSLSGGRLSPNMVTIIGFLAHIPIALLIASGSQLLAALLLVIFGLFDTLDGALARIQNRTTKTGMLLDSVTDRAKEILLYTGMAYAIVNVGRPYMAAWAAAACGSSLLVSYVNAWGEAVLGSERKPSHRMNKAFRSGLMSFEIRMTVLVVGVASGRLILTVMVITIFATLTALTRFRRIFRELHDVQN